VACQQEVIDQVTHAHSQHVERLRYEAQLTQRQFLRVDPDNRLVAAELEKRWNEALSALKVAEEAQAESEKPEPALLALSEELKVAFSVIGQHLPVLWHHELLTQRHRKALLRCLIDKVVLHRPEPATVQARIVWRGGETTTLSIPVPVGSLKDLAGAAEMEQIILERSREGVTDEAIADELTAQGYRSPMKSFVLPSTVSGIRLKHRQFLVRHQSHPRHVEGALTLTQIAKMLDIAPHWIYDRINNGTIEVTKDPTRRLYVFPDTPATLEGFKRLVTGEIKKLRF